jgi:hypothetical protein
MPADVYRVLRKEAQEDPLKFDDHGITQDSRQVTAYLMCHDCEQRLNKNGENWFLANCSRKSGFRLLSRLEDSTPVTALPNRKIYHAAAISGINVQALAYFAASMFWRSSVHPWKMDGRVSGGIDLGQYEEELRTYLMGETEFPEHCVLLVSVPDKSTPFTGFTLARYGGRREGHRIYKLLVWESASICWLAGQSLHRNARCVSCVGIGNPIYKTDALENGILNNLARKSKSHPKFLSLRRI